VRETLSPILMLTALAGRTIDWRGTDLGENWRERRQRGWSEPRFRMTGVVWASDITTVTLPEHFDSTTYPEVEKSLFDALRPGARILVDGSAVTYMSTAGVRALADIWRQAQEREARIVFCRFGGAAADCLMVSGFAQLLDIAGTLKEAKSRLGPDPAKGPAERLHQRRAAG
jgi:anti-sigma B factor antagonist